MNRLIVLLLSAVDALVSVAVGIAVIIAPLTLLWVLALPGADWGMLWPATATVWQFAMLVPVAIALPVEYVVALGMDPAAAEFTMSLAPLAFAAFTIIFAARSGVRASRAEAWITGVLTGTAVVASLAALIALSAQTAVAQVEMWQAVLFPTLLYGVPAVSAAIVMEWRDAGAGAIAWLRDRIQRRGGDWVHVPGLIARGSAVVVVGLIGAGALLVAVAIVLGIADVVALYQASNVDALGAVMLTLAQAAYLPTLIVWALAFIAGPGFVLGAGSTVSAAGTSSSIVPGIPILAIAPDDTETWLLLLALIPVALGAFAGWMARSQLVRAHRTRRDGLLARHDGSHEPIAARMTITAGITVLSAGAAALCAWFASGAFGPGRLAQLGTEPGPVALAVGLEVAVGASILLLSPRSHDPVAADTARGDTARGADPRADSARGADPRADATAEGHVTAPLD